MSPQEPQIQSAEGSPVGEGSDCAAEQTGVLLNQVQQQLDSLKGLISQNGKRQSELQAFDAEVRKRASAVEAREKELAERSKAFDQQMAAQGAELDTRSAALEARIAAIEAKAAQAEQQQASFQTREQELARKQQALDAAQEAIRAREAELAGQKDSGSAALAEAQAKFEQLAGELKTSTLAKAELERARDEAVRTTDAARKHAEAALALAEQAEKKSADFQARIEQLSREAAEKPATDPKTIERMAELEAAIQARQADAAALKQQQDAAQKQHEAAIAQRDKALRELAERVRDAEARAAAVPKVSPESERSAAELERIELRRIRLAKYKRLLGAQSNKIVKAKAAIQKRAQECEAVLAQRAKLAEAFNALEEKKKQIQAKAAKSGAAALVMYALVIFAAVGGMAWGVARQVAPATFAARATIAADGKGRNPSAEELDAWTTTLKALMQDPQVMAAAAENFSRRGMPGLGTASAVKQRFGTLYLQSDKPGELNIEHRGEGAERAARELETFLSAVIAVSNTQLETRGDGAATVVSRPPVPGVDPVDSERLVYAAGIGGGGLLAAGILGTFAYRYLRRAKDKFEHDTGELSALS